VCAPAARPENVEADDVADPLVNVLEDNRPSWRRRCPRRTGCVRARAGSEDK